MQESNLWSPVLEVDILSNLDKYDSLIYPINMNMFKHNTMGMNFIFVDFIDV